MDTWREPVLYRSESVRTWGCSQLQAREHSGWLPSKSRKVGIENQSHEWI